MGRKGGALDDCAQQHRQETEPHVHSGHSSPALNLESIYEFTLVTEKRCRTPVRLRPRSRIGGIGLLNSVAQKILSICQLSVLQRDLLRSPLL